MSHIHPSAINHVTCRYCASEAKALLSSTDFNRHISEQEFTYFRCPNCGLVFLNPIPEDLHRYYEESYHMIPASLDALRRSADAHERFKLDLVSRVKQSGRVIEVGPGSGGFALLAKDAGYEVSVIDMSETACRFIADTVGVRAIHSKDEIAALNAEPQADLITLWHVLEHLRDPISMIRVAASKLAPGGVLMIATPNPNALQFRLFGRWWVHLDAPRHVALIPFRLLHSISTQSGLSLLWVTTTDKGTQFWNNFGWERSLGNLLRDHVSEHRISRLARWASTLSWPLERALPVATAYTAAFAAPPG